MNCRNCNKETTNPSFCNRSCAAIWNNSKHPKRKPIFDRKCKRCGEIGKQGPRQYCQPCKHLIKLDEVQSTPMKHYFMKGNARVKYTSIRDWARRTMHLNKVPKTCKVCGFNIIVECSHINPISSFNENQLMGEVNSLDNLVYLCPNHHAMFDKGLLRL